MKALLVTLLAAALLASATAPALAGVNVERSGSENPMVEVARSTMYGGVTGLILGTALAWASDGNSNDGEYIRWGFVAGTFFGFGYGLYHVQARPRARAMLEFQEGRLALSVPEVRLTMVEAIVPPAREAGVRVAVVGAKF